MAPESERATGRRSVDGARHLWDLPEPGEDAVALADGAEAGVLAREATDRGATAGAAMLVGVAERLVTMTAEYAKERVQFGRPIGAFQAVKHHLATAFVRLEFARPVVYRAALSIDEREATASRDASMAKSMAADAANLAARVALQVHGAIGYTWQHDLHLWMKRAWALSAVWGDGPWHRARALELLADATS
jgi:alkylation response protein AidB-like acyl-CoA dehydrogenase